jgi:nitrite reductase/ring-hydroxylating ferredoxin subunit
MAIFKRIAKHAEIPPGSSRVIEADGTKVAVFNVGGVFHAIHNTCKHRGGPLGEGTVSGSTVTCPWHQWKYDLRTGRHDEEPVIRVSCYQVKLEGDDLLVEL